MKTIETRRYEGARAKEVLDNEVFQQVFSDIKADITEKWETSPARDAEGREKLWMYLAMLNKVESQLKSTLDSGKLAEVEIEHRQSLAQRVVGIWGG